MRPTRLPSDLPNDKFRVALLRLGFELRREGKHSVFKRSDETLPIPRHPRLNRKLMVSLLKGVGVSEEELMEHW